MCCKKRNNIPAAVQDFNLIFLWCRTCLEMKHENLSTFQYCVQIAAGDGVCTFGDSASARWRMQSCQFKNLDAGSSSAVTFRILPLELGLHTVNFTLLTPRNSEIVVKTLRVVVRKKKISMFFSISEFQIGFS